MTDLNTYLLRSRVVFVGSRITDEVRGEDWFRFGVSFLSHVLSFFLDLGLLELLDLDLDLIEIDLIKLQNF